VVVISVLVKLLTVAAVPLKVTVLFTAVGSKLFPSIVTVVPIGPLVGEKLVMLGPEIQRLGRKSREIKATTTKAICCRNPFDVNMVCFLSQPARLCCSSRKTVQESGQGKSLMQ
jgi:hypothetical protein